jgi:hypothetical protein
MFLLILTVRVSVTPGSEDDRPDVTDTSVYRSEPVKS